MTHPQHCTCVDRFLMQPSALQLLFGKETAGHADQYQLEVHTAARRVVSLLLSLKVAFVVSITRSCSPGPLRLSSCI